MRERERERERERSESSIRPRLCWRRLSETIGESRDSVHAIRRLVEERPASFFVASVAMFRDRFHGRETIQLALEPCFSFRGDILCRFR